MARTTANPIDADRNAKERQRNQSLQKIISAIGVEVGMEHLRKQDFLEEALKQLKNYHRIRNEDFALKVALNDVRHQLQRAEEEITRLRGLLSTGPTVLTQPHVKVSSDAQHMDTLQTSGAHTPSERMPPQMPYFLEEQQNDAKMIPFAVPFASSSLPSSEHHAVEVSSRSIGSVSFGDFLHSAEEDMLKDFQEPDIDLLLGDNVSFFELEDAVHSSLSSIQPSEGGNYLPLNPSDLCYTVNDLLNDLEYS